MKATRIPNKYLIGIKAKQYMTTGYVYAPYIPLIRT